MNAISLDKLARKRGDGKAKAEPLLTLDMVVGFQKVEFRLKYEI